MEAGDAVGDGLATGLGLDAGAVSGVLDETAGDGVAVGELVLVAGSQAAAKAIETTASSSRADRPSMFVLVVFIRLCLVSGRLKSETIIARWLIGSNGCSHTSLAGISARPAPKPSFLKRLHD